MGILQVMRMSLTMVYPESVQRNFKITFQHSDGQEIEFDRPAEFYNWAMGTTLLSFLITHFDIRLEEFTIICCPKSIRFMSYHSESETTLKSGDKLLFIH